MPRNQTTLLEYLIQAYFSNNSFIKNIEENIEAYYTINRHKLNIYVKILNTPRFIAEYLYAKIVVNKREHICPLKNYVEPRNLFEHVPIVTIPLKPNEKPGLITLTIMLGKENKLVEISEPLIILPKHIMDFRRKFLGVKSRKPVVIKKSSLDYTIKMEVRRERYGTSILSKENDITPICFQHPTIEERIICVTMTQTIIKDNNGEVIKQIEH